MDENEHIKDPSNNTTLKLKEDIEDSKDGSDNYNDTTLKINQSDSNIDGKDSPERDERRLIINITFQGVASNDKQISHDSNKLKSKSDKYKESKSVHRSSKHSETDKDSKSENKSSKYKDIEKESSKSGHKSTKHKVLADKERTKSDKKPNKNKEDSDQEAKSDNKPIAKRKIKALFGESSESDVELEQPKKMKLSEDHKHKHKHKHKSKHLKDKKSEKVEHEKAKQSPKAINEATLFGTNSDSESEKELIIDDGRESQAKSDDVEKTMVLSNSDDHNTLNSSMESNISAENISNNAVNTQNNSEGIKSIQELHENDQNELNNAEPSLIMEIDEKKLSKAYRLSLEAEKVLENLKKFAEMPHDEPVIPVVVEENNVELVDETQPQNKSDKQKESSKHRRLTLSKSKERKKSKEGKHEKQEKTSLKERKEKHDKKKEKKTKKSEKVDVASLVVKLLMPYYKNKKITNRDLFKITARHIVHQLLAIQVTGNYLLELYNVN